MTDYSYPKSKRLLKPKSFKTVFDKPIFKVHGNHLMAFACNTDQKHARLGMAITKKKAPTAVQRNQIKRLTRERFRHLHYMLPALDIVFILKKSPHTLDNQQLANEITTIFEKVIKISNHARNNNRKR